MPGKSLISVCRERRNAVPAAAFARPFGFLLLFLMVSARTNAQSEPEKYGNVNGYADSIVLSWLQKAFPNDKLNHYEVPLNGKKTQVRNYYDYLAFQVAIGDSFLPQPAATNSNTTTNTTTTTGPGDSAVRVKADTALGKAVDSAQVNIIRPAHDTALERALPMFVDSGFRDTAPAAQSKGAAENLARRDSALAGDSAVSLTNSELYYQFVIPDSTGATGSMTRHDTLAAGAAPPARDSLVTASTASTVSTALPGSRAVASRDSLAVVNFGPNSGRNGCYMLVIYVHDAIRQTFVLGQDPFQQDFQKLQAFTEKVGAPLQKYLVEIWDLFIKCRQQVVFTPLYLH